MLKIAPDVHVLFRADWGARTDLPRLGVVLPPAVATEAIMHHTVIIDQDATPNRWESVSEVIIKMRQLQTIRPDLGLDVPYSYVAFLMRYSHKLGLILCEGRGPYRRGAHTKWHNVTGRAVAIEGNTEIGLPIDPYAAHLSHAWGWIKDEYGLINLGNVTPGRGGIVYGHTDFRRDDDRSTWTACPGQGMMAVIDQLTLTRWEASVPLEEDDMITHKLLFQGIPFSLTWLVQYVAGVPVWKRYINYQQTVDHLATKFGKPETIDGAQLRTVPTLPIPH